MLAVTALHKEGGGSLLSGVEVEHRHVGSYDIFQLLDSQRGRALCSTLEWALDSSRHTLAASLQHPSKGLAVKRSEASCSASLLLTDSLVPYRRCTGEESHTAPLLLKLGMFLDVEAVAQGMTHQQGHAGRRASLVRPSAGAM